MGTKDGSVAPNSAEGCEPTLLEIGYVGFPRGPTTSRMQAPFPVSSAGGLSHLRTAPQFGAALWIGTFNG